MTSSAWGPTRFGVLFDQCLEAVDRFVESSGCVPVRSLLRVHSEFDPFRARLHLAEADCGNWRNCECDARNTSVVRPMPVAVEKVLRNDLAIMARYRRERRGPAFGGTRRGKLWGLYAPPELAGVLSTPFGYDAARCQIERPQIVLASRRL